MAFPKYISALFLSLFFSCSALAVEQDLTLDFVYVSPNTGHAAGGHYGLKLGGFLYHYQFFANGEFLLVRDSWQKFTLIYAELSNRPIHIAEVPVDTNTFEKVEHQLAQTLVRQKLDHQQRHDLIRAQRLLDSLKSDNSRIVIPAVGFFAVDNSVGADRLSTSLRQKVAADIGGGAFAEKISRIEQRIALHETKPVTAQWSLELQNMLQKKVALEVIDSGRSLSESAVIAPLPDELPLNEDVLAALKKYRQTVYQSLLRLIVSDRAGDGSALLLQLARYHVLSLSLEEGRLYSLDPFPEDALTITLSEQIVESDALQNLYRAQLLDRRNLIEQMVTGQHHELVINRLEEVRGRMAELDKVFQGADQIRYDRGKMVPEKSGAVHYDFQFSEDTLEEAITDISYELKQANQEILTNYSYNLLGRNCVTEMNHQLNASFSSREEGESQLGGWISPGEQFSFSPFMFHSLVKKNYNLHAKEEIPSRRLRQLEDQQLDSLIAWLRESNAMTSTLYTRRDRDTAFLMFTDNNWALRPVFGLVNAGYGALYTLVGVLTLPFDKGERLEQGAQGVFYSFPELVFVNIRKGTYLAPDYSFLEESP